MPCINQYDDPQILILFHKQNNIILRGNQTLDDDIYCRETIKFFYNFGKLVYIQDNVSEHHMKLLRKLKM